MLGLWVKNVIFLAHESKRACRVDRGGRLVAGAAKRQSSSVSSFALIWDRNGFRKPSIDVPPGTLNSVLKQAGLK